MNSLDSTMRIASTSYSGLAAPMSMRKTAPPLTSLALLARTFLTPRIPYSNPRKTLHRTLRPSSDPKLRQKSKKCGKCANSKRRGLRNSEKLSKGVARNYP